MISIIENRAIVEGIVCSITNNASLQNFQILDFELIKSYDVAGYPNLALADEGNIIRINVKNEQLNRLKTKPGDPLSCQVRKAFGQVYFFHEM